MGKIEVIDLFSAAAGGWSLGMHRAGYRTIAACEVIPWRRAVYAENNPDVRLYDDVRTLTAGRLLADLGRLPSIVVGSPPCQDISSANTKGRGVEGERSGLYFEAIRIIGECRPRWFALENSANLRTRGADAVLSALEAIGYACWPVVVRAGDIGANHERPRCWLVGCDVEQVTDVPGVRCDAWAGLSASVEWDEPADLSRHTAQDGRGSGISRGRAGAVAGAEQSACRDAGRSADEPGIGQMGLCPADRSDAIGCRADWTLADLADHLRLDDGLSAWLAGQRIAIGDGKGSSAASLIVEAFGDAVIPQIPEAIGRAILRTESALAAIYRKAAA